MKFRIKFHSIWLGNASAKLLKTPFIKGVLFAFNCRYTSYFPKAPVTREYELEFLLFFLLDPLTNKSFRNKPLLTDVIADVRFHGTLQST
jgi:hypothetical protein